MSRRFLVLKVGNALLTMFLSLFKHLQFYNEQLRTLSGNIDTPDLNIGYYRLHYAARERFTSDAFAFVWPRDNALWDGSVLFCFVCSSLPFSLTIFSNLTYSTRGASIHHLLSFFWLIARLSSANCLIRRFLNMICTASLNRCGSFLPPSSTPHSSSMTDSPN